MVDEYAELSRKTARLFAHMSDAVVADFYFKIDDDVGAFWVWGNHLQRGLPKSLCLGWQAGRDGVGRCCAWPCAHHLHTVTQLASIMPRLCTVALHAHRP